MLLLPQRKKETIENLINKTKTFKLSNCSDIKNPSSYCFIHHNFYDHMKALKTLLISCSSLFSDPVSDSLVRSCTYIQIIICSFKIDIKGSDFQR